MIRSKKLNKADQSKADRADPHNPCPAPRLVRRHDVGWCWPAAIEVVEIQLLVETDSATGTITDAGFLTLAMHPLGYRIEVQSALRTSKPRLKAD